MFYCVAGEYYKDKVQAFERAATMFHYNYTKADFKRMQNAWDSMVKVGYVKICKFIDKNPELLDKI